MKRLEGGYLGGRPTWSLASNPGIWGIEQVFARRVAGTWPTGAGSLDEYYEYVTFTLHADGANGSTSFPDSSLLGNAVAVNGNAQVSTTQSKFGGSSIAFDGNGDYLVASSSSAFALQAGDWTIECWVYFNALSGYQNIIDFRTTSAAAICPIVGSNGSDLQFDVGSTNCILAAGALAINNWYHIAVSKSGNSTRMFLNGTQVGSTYTDSNSYVNNSSLNIGRYPVSNISFLNGYIDELRITKGYARYTSNFSVPTGPYEDEGAPLADPFINSVSLLLPMNGSNNSTTFTDKSPNALTVTANGDAKLSTAVKRYGVSSAYFDGTGDYLVSAISATAFNLSDDWTIEFWVYPTLADAVERTYVHVNAGGPGGIHIHQNGQVLKVDNGLVADYASGNILVLNRWQYISVTKKDTLLYVFLDGSLLNTRTAQSYTSGNRCQIGRYSTGGTTSDFAGYIDDLRITKGVARYLANFIPPLPHADYGTLADPYLAASTLWMPMEGPVNSTGFFDRADRQIVTTVGNAKISNAQYKWGLTSAALDGSGDYLTLPLTTSLQFGSDDFTVECWVYLVSRVSSYPCIFSNYSSYAAGSISLFAGHGSANTSKYQVAINGVAFPPLQSATDIRYSSWTHLAVVRNGNTLTLYINGVANGTYTVTGMSFNGNGSLFGVGTALDNVANGYINGYIDDFRIVKGHALYTTNFTPPTAPINADTSSDPYLSNVSLLLKMDGDNNSTTFTDSSLTPNTVTANGDAKISTAQSKFGGSSAVFDGTGDRLTLASSPLFGFGTGDFTCECWIYRTVSANQNILDFRTATDAQTWVWNISSNLIGMYTPSGTLVSGTTVLAANQWYHVAITRSGGTIRHFLNGVLDGSGTNASDFQSSRPLTIGGTPDASTGMFSGYIDDLRITKGVARYTANFIPPTISHPVWSETDASFSSVSLLLNGNGANASTIIADRSSNGLTLVPNGNAQISTTQSRFGGSSLYFDGTGDYLSLASSSQIDLGSSDFTIEFWVQFSSLSGIVGLLGKRAAEANYSPFLLEVNTSTLRLFISTTGSSWEVNGLSSGTLTIGQWYHIAIVRSGTVVYMFVNGTSVGSTGSVSGALMTNATAMTIGRGAVSISASVDLNGYIDDLRITKGVARYTADFTPPIAPHPIPVIDPYFGAVSLLLHMNGANASTYFPDHSYNALAVTAFGNAQISTAQSKFGGASALFDGSGDYLRIPDGPGFQLSGVNFTVEAWIYPVSLASYAGIISKDKYGANFSWAIGIASTYLQTVSNNSGTSNLTSSYAFTTNTWYHIALVKNGTTVSHYVNGTLIGSSSLNISEATSDYITIGCLSWNNPAYFFNGYIEDVRVTKGIARYTSNFTPPTTQFPNS